MAHRLQAEHDLPSAEINAIEQRLNSDNRLLTGRDDDRGLVFTLRDKTGCAVASPPAIPRRGSPNSN
ncbi:hypothetical protein [Mesorhizobium sp.]|uniref:hypothetical protein n=1 Tax=Mesorhizobium sp. TaxID=1871066 RepID=UPI0025BBB5B6|nr:hypothetical protein [Mesorhizobium sp.]